jgi:DNA polymerase III subunit delta'
MDNNWDIVGNAWAVEMLKQQLLRDTVRHAYLFTGPPGIGRRTLALRFIQALNCPHLSREGIPCEDCNSCRQIERMQYADLSIVESGRVGGVLKSEQVRSIRQSLVLKPYLGKYRVVLFLRFQEANSQASNALLKMAEEAPPHALLILTADNPEQLLPTITSRCEVIRLRPVPFDDVMSHLQSRGVEREKARLLAHVSGGRPGYALRLLQGEEGELKFRKEKLEDLQNLLHSNLVQRFSYTDKLTRRRKRDDDREEQARDTLLVWLSFFRDVLMFNAGEGGNQIICNMDMESEIKVLSDRLSLTQARHLVQDAERSLVKLDHNVNARLLMEVLLMDWPRLPSA